MLKMLLASSSIVSSPYALSFKSNSVLAQNSFEASQDLYKFLHTICDLIIPDTDSPGAIKAGVLERFSLSYSYLEANDAKRWLEKLLAVKSLINERSSSEFMSLSILQRKNVLIAFDKAAFSDNDSEYQVYKNLKEEIATAYYTTPAGASIELKYLPVPGQWKPCIPLEEVGRTWAL